MPIIIAQPMIVFEDKLTEMFNDLPAMKYTSLDVNTYIPSFGYGDELELNLFLKNKKEEGSPYPLIWLLYPYEEEHEKRKLIVENVNLILAVDSNSSMRNPQRLAETYSSVLNPLFENIRELFKRANNVNIAESYKLVKHPNYSKSEDREQHAGTLVWDALKITFEKIVIIDVCYRKVEFI